MEKSIRIGLSLFIRGMIVHFLVTIGCPISSKAATRMYHRNSDTWQSIMVLSILRSLYFHIFKYS